MRTLLIIPFLIILSSCDQQAYKNAYDQCMIKMQTVEGYTPSDNDRMCKEHAKNTYWKNQH